MSDKVLLWELQIKIHSLHFSYWRTCLQNGTFINFEYILMIERFEIEKKISLRLEKMEIV